MRRQNLRLVLRHVSRNGKSSRAQLASATGLTKATVSSLVAELLDAYLLIELGPEPRGLTGRPGSALALNPDRYAGIGLEINVDYVAACVTDLKHRIRYHHVECADNRADAKIALDRLARLGSVAIRAAHEMELTPCGITLALPGIVDQVTGRLLRAPNLNWTDLPVVESLGDRLDVRPEEIHLDNEANLAALGELWFGGGEALGDFIHVSGEIGIGAGIVTRRALYRGARGFAGEIGHISIDPSGELCGCGGRGCLERFCGQEAMLRAAGLPPAAPATSTGDPGGPISGLLAALQRGEQQAIRAVRQGGEALGIGLAGVANVVDPDTIVLGGIFTPLASWLMEPFTAALLRQTVVTRWAPPRVAVSSLGPQAAVRGAAGSVVQRILADPSLFISGEEE